MKYKSFAELVAASKSGEFTGHVIIDNDCVNAYQGDDLVFDFNDSGAECALFEALTELGLSPEFC